MLDLLANVGLPSTDSRENSVVAGVRRALELLCLLNPRQMEVTYNRPARYTELVAAVINQVMIVMMIMMIMRLSITRRGRPSSAGDIGLIVILIAMIMMMSRTPSQVV